MPVIVHVLVHCRSIASARLRSNASSAHVSVFSLVPVPLLVPRRLPVPVHVSGPVVVRVN